MGNFENFSCPADFQNEPVIILSHGGGGKYTQQLLERIFYPAFGNSYLNAQHDGAALPVQKGQIAFTTDSFVVRPIFFPGGDIGRLAIFGTVNDLAMCGAEPRFLSAAFILEEGFPLSALERVIESMKQAAAEAGVEVVTGDTKVVEKGKGDGIFINTAGIGFIEASSPIRPEKIRLDDAVILSGDLGRHGVAIWAAREEMYFESTLESDCGCLVKPVMALLREGIEIHCMRDLTRGGLSGAMVEIAGKAEIGIKIEEKAIPVSEEVKAACELLGFDPLTMANEGRCAIFLPPSQVEEALRIMRTFPISRQACVIGKTVSEPSGRVSMKTAIGSNRIVEMPRGDLLPRIC